MPESSKIDKSKINGKEYGCDDQPHDDPLELVPENLYFVKDKTFDCLRDRLHDVIDGLVDSLHRRRR